LGGYFFYGREGVYPLGNDVFPTRPRFLTIDNTKVRIIFNPTKLNLLKIVKILYIYEYEKVYNYHRIKKNG
jgi:hypothetical protein